MQRVRVRAAQGVAPEHPRGEEVAGVRELAGHFRDRVDAPDRLADAAELELACSRPARREANGVEDLRVAGAAAEVAGERLADLVVVRARRSPQQVDRGHDQSRRAEAALHGAGLDERLLDRGAARSPSASPSTVTTSCPSACAASTRHAQTSVPSRSTEQEPHSPCSQAFFEPGKPEALAQRVEQALARPDVRLALLAVDRQLRSSRETPVEGPFRAGRGARAGGRRPCRGRHRSGSLPPERPARETSRARRAGPRPARAPGLPSRTRRAARRAPGRRRAPASRRRSPSRFAGRSS